MAKQVTDGRSVVRLGVVGCGFFGRLLAHSAAAGGGRVVAVTDTYPPAAETLAAELGCDVEQGALALANRADVDAVFVATPNHAHVAPVLAAISAGKHVFVEKPMAIQATDCEQMLAAAQVAGVRLLVGHIMRLFPAVAKMRHAIESGEIGRPLVARAVRVRWVNLADQPANWWKLNAALSGGDLMHEIHELDLLCWLLGEVKAVSARIANLAHTALPGYDDVIQLSLEFENGALATLEMGTAYHRPEWTCWISGTEGAVALDLRAGSLSHYRADGSSQMEGVFELEEANASLRESAQIKGLAHNTASTRPALWMAHAVELEMRDALEHFRSGAPSALKEAPDRAVKVGEQALLLDQDARIGA